MQVLKEEVRKKIRKAAIKSFKEIGYKKTSMRIIAEDADMSVGNLYRYYKNKETLFGTLVKPMIEMFQNKQYYRKKMSFDLLEVNLLEHSVFMERLVEARLNFRDELFILLLRAEGSPFEGAKSYFSDFIKERFKELLKKNDLDEKNFFKGDLLVETVSAGITESFCLVLEYSKTDEMFLTNMLDFIELIIKPAIRNMVAINNNQTNYRRISDEEVNRFYNSHRNTRNVNSSKSDGTFK